ncbi:DUF397 domain-containing protein [Nocardia sp. R6R-6]|uniref:DUF397 domain-containing protein n=1 Tax=Nocardia sp. R6R-6 TaxID=3459303 RepID=UPI00403D6559
MSSPQWFKSSYSGNQADCVEVAFLDGGQVVGVRDSKNPTGPMVAFTPAEWDAFLAGARDGEFSQP